MTELERRKVRRSAPYFDEPFARFRGTDAPEDAAATAKRLNPGTPIPRMSSPKRDACYRGIAASARGMPA